MPYIQLDGMVVHVKMSKPRRRRCAAWSGPKGQQTRCSTWSGFLCDFKLSSGKTCDAPLCAEHAHQVAADRHHCPSHHQRHVAGVQRSLFTSLGIKP